MLKGVDVSTWQGDINISSLPVDFVIIKATEGTKIVDRQCDKNVQKAKKSNKLWGFYHYANNYDPIKEADYFISNCEGYFGEGIPVLDWEDNQSVEWVNKFVRRVYEKKKVWCWIYANPWRFKQGGVEKNCMRWIASYPSVQSPTHEQASKWDCPNADVTPGAWQFCSDGKLSGYIGCLDLDIFYGDKDAWIKYAKGIQVEIMHPEPKRTFVVENSKYKITVEEK